ncbi:MAG: phosphomannomutase [Lachnospiraceae bacterium]|nr:phosphomannomutase [Lachnospiraceae bacterium]
MADIKNLDKSKLKLIAFDLDGTLTQHKQPMDEKNHAMLVELSKRYRLVMVGAGQTGRIFKQMEEFPIDIIGNYGLQYAKYNHETKSLDVIRDESFPCDRESVEKRADHIREKYGYTTFAGDSVEYHPSGCITLALLGTKACQADKLAFDPDRVKRRRFYDEVVELFPEYNVFVGGSSSFDMAPKPYHKYYALDLYCRENNLSHENVVFVGDDYGLGGNDESVYRSDIAFLCVDDYREFAQIAKCLL